MKELVTLRKKPLKAGGYSLFLDYSIDGQRVKEYLKMYLLPETSKLIKLQNEETLNAARVLQAKKTIEIQNQVAGIIRPSAQMLSDFINSVVDHYIDTGHVLFAKSMHPISSDVRKFGDVSLSAITPKYIQQWIDYIIKDKVERDGKVVNRNAPNTVHYKVVLMRRVMRIAIKQRLIKSDPFEHIDTSDLPRKTEVIKRFLTMEEVERLINTPCASESLKQMFLFACFCGLRISNLESLTWDEITEINGVKYVIALQIKTKKAIQVPLSNNALRWLPERGESKLVWPNLNVRNTRAKYLDQWVKDAGIKGKITFHCSRHTNATLMLTYGADIYTVSKILGHSSVKTTQIYAKVIDQKKQEAVNLIPEIK